jgi:hypothetical protein
MKKRKSRNHEVCSLKKGFFSAFLFLILAIFITAAAQNKAAAKLSKNQKRSLARLWFETQGRLDGKECVYYIRGSAYSYIQGERPRELFKVEGYNIRRLIETPEKDGYFVATREIVFYEDSRTGEILNQWQNPWTKENNEVFHITNDPVNFRYRIREGKYIAVSMDGKREYGEREEPEMWNSYFVWHSDVFPFYALPQLKKNYTAGELFDFYVPQDELNRTGAPKVMISWSRVSPWLPWMKMDEQPGAIVIHARSIRREDWNLLPEKIKTAVKTKFPLYQHAPDAVDPTQPNATSWTVYYNEMKKREKN